MIVTDARVAEFVSRELGVSICPPFTAMGIERDGEIIAGVIFHCYEGAAVHVTVAGNGWTLGFVRAVGDYVYRQLGCERMTLTSEHDDVIAYAQRLGGKVEGVLRSQYGAGRDATIVGILRDEYRFDAR